MMKMRFVTEDGCRIEQNCRLGTEMVSRKWPSARLLAASPVGTVGSGEATRIGGRDLPNVG